MNDNLKMIDVVNHLFPFKRCLMGSEVRRSLDYLESKNTQFSRLTFPSGYKAFDWEVPDEWILNRACLIHESGDVIADSDRNFLEVVIYSNPIDTWINKDDLLNYLHYSSIIPHAIPYVTSYYEPKWGFCLTQHAYNRLPDGMYHVKVDSHFAKSNLDISHAIIPGKSNKEVFLTSYLCHPNLANNELSGPALLMKLAEYISSINNRHYTYRLVLAPETIGSLCYLSKYLNDLKANVIAGYVLSCVGDNRAYSHICSPSGNNVSDTALRSALIDKPNHIEYSFMDRGSDERQYCSPNVNLPVCGFSRSKYATYPEYHTSEDNLNLVTEEGLSGSFIVIRDVIDSLERGCIPISSCIGEPRLGKRGLYSVGDNIGNRELNTVHIENILAYSNGINTIYDISRICQISLSDAMAVFDQLLPHNLINLKHL